MAKKKHPIPERTEKHRILWVILLYLVIGIVIYSNTFHVPFIFDDYHRIVQNDSIKRNEIFYQLNVSRYIGYVSFALNYKINQLNTNGYHVVNTIIHIINSFLVYLLAYHLLSTGNNPLSQLRNLFSFFAGLLFLVHPIQTQAVTYIIQRFTSLAALFSLGAILCYIKFRMAAPAAKSWYVMSIISALFAYKTKENTATLPFMILTLEFIFFNDTALKTGKRILYALPYFILIAVIPLSFMHASTTLKEAWGEAPVKSFQPHEITHLNYFITELRVMVTYMRLMVLPIRQSIDYYYPLSLTIFEFPALMSLSFILLLIFASLLVIKKQPFIVFGILWFFIFLFIESSVIPLPDVIFEHRVYLPSIGFIIAILSALFYFCKKELIVYYKYGLIAIAIILSILTFMRNTQWKDEITLWNDALTGHPMNIRSYLSLATAYADKENFGESIKLLDKALEVSPDNFYVHRDLANYYAKSGLFDAAIIEYERALQIDSHNITPYLPLSTLYMHQRKTAQAIALLIKAHELDKANPVINATLGYCYCKSGDAVAGLKWFKKSIEIEPDLPNTYFQLGYCLLSIDEFRGARDNFLKALELKPDYVNALYFIALSYELEGNKTQALDYYKKFLASSPPDNPLLPQAHTRLHSLESGP